MAASCSSAAALRTARLSSSSTMEARLLLRPSTIAFPAARHRMYKKTHTLPTRASKLIHGLYGSLKWETTPSRIRVATATIPSLDKKKEASAFKGSPEL